MNVFVIWFFGGFVSFVYDSVCGFCIILLVMLWFGSVLDLV